jgi:hypothetical protein
MMKKKINDEKLGKLRIARSRIPWGNPKLPIGGE